MSNYRLNTWQVNVFRLSFRLKWSKTTLIILVWYSNYISLSLVYYLFYSFFGMANGKQQQEWNCRCCFNLICFLFFKHLLCTHSLTHSPTHPPTHSSWNTHWWTVEWTEVKRQGPRLNWIELIVECLSGSWGFVMGCSKSVVSEWVSEWVSDVV